MNPWGRKTVRIAKTKDYLDRLYEIYPNEVSDRRVDEKILKSVQELFTNKNSIELLEMLLDLDKFPIKDSYVSFLRNDRTALKRNPQTVRRLCNILYEMGFEKVKQGIIAPKEANTARGPQFTRWIKKQFKHLKVDDFKMSAHSIVFLDDNERNIMDFCNVNLDLGVGKRPDFVAKSGKKYVVGEAKFLSSLGGNQGRGLDDALKLALNPSGKAYKIAIVDGVLWIVPGSQEYKKIEHANASIFSALYLREYLKKL
jgi:hypothetical protein